MIQPLIAPLYSGRSLPEILELFASGESRNGYEILREYWSRHVPAGQHFEQFWARSIHDGFIADSAFPRLTPELNLAPVALQNAPAVGDEVMELVFRRDSSTYDGRFANNAWLQEIPRPLTKITWDNALLMSPATARHLGVKTGDVVQIKTKGSSIEAPVFVLAGIAPFSATVHFGYGRTLAGNVGSSVGFNAFAIRESERTWMLQDVQIKNTGRSHDFSCTQNHHGMDYRDLVRTATLAAYQKNPAFSHALHEDPAPDNTLYPAFPNPRNAWAMSIDLNACVGCNACVLACQAENNIPVVGKEQIAIGREMHWLRIDQYFNGSIDNPSVYNMPVPCMHCETAPCEVVCPTEATSHSDEGLNQMTYNRCIGTRFCSNNCPYKVRRFNFLQYSDWQTPELKALRNPNVSVRERGVMEKCTYCVQRITMARIEAEAANRPINDGEIVTACQAVCPAEAIVFGNLNDPKSKVTTLKKQPRDYGLLTQLNTRPRTTYLAAVRNPNPDLGGEHGGTAS
jgi:molybdopterin-containing oxidoreductase family iron-sulfur binding subunit